jgi:hypothetical protein
MRGHCVWGVKQFVLEFLRLSEALVADFVHQNESRFSRSFFAESPIDIGSIYLKKIIFKNLCTFLAHLVSLCDHAASVLVVVRAYFVTAGAIDPKL